MAIKESLSTNEQLKKLMKQHKLTRPAVAEMIKVSVRTIDSWLAYPNASHSRGMSSTSLELFKLKLNAKKTKK